MDAQVEALLKDQINKELYSAYFYLAIAGYYQGRSLDGSVTGSPGSRRKNRGTPSKF